MARINPDAFYVDGTPLPASYWQALDTAQFQSWNGDIGSSHNPTGTILIGGAGMWFTGAVPFSGVYPNGVVFSASSQLVHGANDWTFTLPFRSRQPITGLGRAFDCSYSPVITAGQFDPQSHSASPASNPAIARFRFAATSDAITNVSPGGPNGSGTQLPLVACMPYYTGGRVQCPLRVHHNGTLASVIFSYKFLQNRTANAWAASTQYTVTSTSGVAPFSYVTAAGGLFRCVQSGTSGASAPTWPTTTGGLVADNTVVWARTGNAASDAMPASQPAFRAIKVDTFGNVTPLQTNTTNGWVALTGGSPSTYYNLGGIQQLTYPCDANVVVDITQFTYWAQILDESDIVPGTASSGTVPAGNAFPGNEYISAACVINNITDIRPA